MIVEFVGPPGAGKTTVSELAAQLVPDARSGTLNIYGGPLWRHRTSALVSNPRLGWALARHAPRSRKGVSATLRLLRSDRLARLLPDEGVTFLDSGVIFSASWALKHAGIRPAAVAGHLALPDVALVLAVDPDVASRRLGERRQMPSRSEGTSAMVAGSQRYIRAVLDEIPTATVTIAADGAADAVASAAAREILTIIGETR